MPMSRRPHLKASRRSIGRFRPKWAQAVHDYVQWIFPTDEASMFNSQAPLLSPGLQAICRKDEQIQKNFEARFARA